MWWLVAFALVGYIACGWAVVMEERDEDDVRRWLISDIFDTKRKASKAKHRLRNSLLSDAQTDLFHSPKCSSHKFTVEFVVIDASEIDVKEEFSEADSSAI